MPVAEDRLPHCILAGYDTCIAVKSGRGDRVWVSHPGAVVSSFRYLRDRLFLTCSSLYALNRWGLKPRVHSAFLHDHFNDLLLIPCALPPLLLIQRWLKLRLHDRKPTPGEILLYLFVWSILFEVIGPHLMPWTVGDPGDVVAYVAGGILAGLWWHHERMLVPFSRHEL